MVPGLASDLNGTSRYPNDLEYYLPLAVLERLPSEIVLDTKFVREFAKSPPYDCHRLTREGI